MTGQPKPSLTAAMVGVVGFIALAAGIASSGALRTFAVIGFVLLAVSVLVGVVVQRVIQQKYPPVIFDRTDISAAEGKIEAARLRLAAGDTAAFGIHPVMSEPGDAEGQIWLFAVADGVLDRIALELALPDSVEDVSRHPGVAALLSVGWQIQSVKAHEWVILSRSDLPDATGLVSPVVEAITALFAIPPESRWTCRAFA